MSCIFQKQTCGTKFLTADSSQRRWWTTHLSGIIAQFRGSRVSLSSFRVCWIRLQEELWMKLETRSLTIVGMLLQMSQLIRGLKMRTIFSETIQTSFSKSSWRVDRIYVFRLTKTDLRLSIFQELVEVDRSWMKHEQTWVNGAKKMVTMNLLVDFWRHTLPQKVICTHRASLKSIFRDLPILAWITRAMCSLCSTFSQ